MADILGLVWTLTAMICSAWTSENPWARWYRELATDFFKVSPVNLTVRALLVSTNFSVPTRPDYR